MNNNEILEKYYPFILELKQKFGANDDCTQMICMDLLETPHSKLQSLYNKNELKYWITRVFKNYWFSKNSRYYYQYKKYYEIVKEPIEQQIIDEENYAEED